jgi:hypothetical protein
MIPASGAALFEAAADRAGGGGDYRAECAVADRIAERHRSLHPPAVFFYAGPNTLS